MLDSLVEKMTARDPGQRPSAQEALRVLDRIQSSTTPLIRNSRLRPMNEGLLGWAFNSAICGRY